MAKKTFQLANASNPSATTAANQTALDQMSVKALKTAKQHAAKTQKAGQC